MEMIITEELINSYACYLHSEEMSRNTISKYIADVRKFMEYADGRVVDRNLVIAYKEYLVGKGYKDSSVNSYLNAVSGFFEHMEWYGLKVKKLKVQKEPFRPEHKELTQEEYEKLINTALYRGRERTAMIIMTICVMGLRVSELKYLTVKAVRCGMMRVSNKGKIRHVVMTEELQGKLLVYIENHGITDGTVFRTRTGKPVHRGNIWRDMKGLCGEAGVDPKKVYPHNLRHLFARIHYEIHRDIVKLADILGHSSVETTRIYTMTNSREYRKQLSVMGLVPAVYPDRNASAFLNLMT